MYYGYYPCICLYWSNTIWSKHGEKHSSWLGQYSCSGLLLNTWLFLQRLLAYDRNRNFQPQPIDIPNPTAVQWIQTAGSWPSPFPCESHARVNWRLFLTQISRCNMLVKCLYYHIFFWFLQLFLLIFCGSYICND